MWTCTVTTGRCWVFRAVRLRVDDSFDVRSVAVVAAWLVERSGGVVGWVVVGCLVRCWSPQSLVASLLVASCSLLVDLRVGFVDVDD